MSTNDVQDFSLAINQKEKQVLYALSLNARENLANIARELKLSRQVVSYNLESLENKGIIEGYYTILNINRLGFLYHRVFLKFRNIDLENEKHIISECRQNKKIGWIIQHEGHWDLALIIWAKNTIEFEEVLDDFLERFGECIAEKNFSVSTSIHHLKHKYLLGKKSLTDLVLGGNPEEAEIDETDYEILGILCKDARRSLIEIGEAVSLSPGMVKNRIEKLHEKEIILGYNLKLNHRLLGYTHFKIFLFLNQSSRQSLAELINYLKGLSCTIYITRAVGIADLEFEVLVQTQSELSDVVKSLRLKHPNLIRNYESITISYEPYINYLPIKK
ncbi:MAG: Lrp/AsnC family transcriptional regulator [SAR324 cluster bacterium]|nr:Lrp/AsnC family transcriptional regulator [SAR324 cluster bacterium]